MLLLMVLSISVAYSQKKKGKASASAELAKSGVASVKMNKTDLLLIVAKDTMVLAKKKDKAPLNCKVVPVKVKANTFYCVTWNESTITEAKLKKEEANVTESQIWNPATKTLLIGNTQKAVKIKEIVFLDKLKTASETQERTRNEGYAFTLLPNGEFSLKNKSSDTKYAYNEKSSRYEPKKK